jgi:hypothetical protein
MAYHNTSVLKTIIELLEIVLLNRGYNNASSFV